MSDERCRICGNENEEILERHHIVPRRFGGGDESENIACLCPNCHSAIERMYNKRFYDELGVEVEDKHEDVDRTCAHKKCTSEETVRISGSGFDIWVCSEHKRCERDWCGRRNVGIVPNGKGGARLICDKHRVCASSRCANQDVTLVGIGNHVAKLFCESHATERRVA